jgi:hypothetical protein
MTSSIRTLCREFVAAHDRLIDRHHRDVELAWMVARLTRAQTIPALHTLLVRQPQRPQTVDEQRQVLRMLSAQYGIPLREARTHAG